MNNKNENQKLLSQFPSLKTPFEVAEKERPMLMSGPMVRALLAGTKTQTRRIVSPQPTGEQRSLHEWSRGIAAACHDHMPTSTRLATHAASLKGRIFPFTSPSGGLVSPFCPYGKPGDRLWMREEHYRFGHWEPVPGVKTKTGRMKWRFVPDRDEVLFDVPTVFRKGRHHQDPATPAWHKRLGRFMPRTLSRIMLKITSIRVERLQDISEHDAIAEGVRELPLQAGEPGAWWTADVSAGQALQGRTPVAAYRELWESLNGAGSWAANPWVWVVEFRRV